VQWLRPQRHSYPLKLTKAAIIGSALATETRIDQPLQLTLQRRLQLSALRSSPLLLESIEVHGLNAPAVTFSMLAVQPTALWTFPSVAIAATDSDTLLSIVAQRRTQPQLTVQSRAKPIAINAIAAIIAAPTTTKVSNI
jgi:hypothetical protein